jgi:outer membrane protein TolC
MRRGVFFLAVGVSFLVAAAPLLPEPAPLTLDDAYLLTRKGSELVRLKELAVQKSRLVLDEAGSRAWPRVDMQASVSYLTNPPPGYTVAAGSLGSLPYPDPPAVATTQIKLPPQDFTVGAQLHNYFTLTAALSQPIFTWGKIRNAIDLAGLEVDTAATALVAQQRDIDREVHRAYFSAVLARDSERTLTRLRDTAALILSDRRGSFDQGTTNRQDVLEAQANLAAIEARLAEAAQSKATALEGLGILTGLDPAAIVLTTGYRADSPQLDEAAMQESAHTVSTDLATVRARMSQARKKLDVEKGGTILHPDVSLGVRVDVSGQEDLGYNNNWSWNWNNSTWNADLVISIGVKMGVFDAMASARRVQQAEKDLEMAGAGVTQAEKMVRLDVRRAVDAVVRADAQVKEKQAGAELAQERLKNARLSFDTGAISRDDLHGADIMAGTAELDLQLALFTREEALADLARLTAARL